MEKSLGLLASAAIFNPLGIKDVYSQLGDKQPSEKELMELCWALMFRLNEVGEFEIEGEPSEGNNLDYRVTADKKRLNELLHQLAEELTEELRVELDLDDKTDRKTPKKEDLTPELLQWVFDHTSQFQQLVDLARAYCDAQNQAFLNKLSRAFQKPDFCIRRDAIPGCTDLLPLSLSWNADWYYGKHMTAPPSGGESTSAQPLVKGNSVAKSRSKVVKV